MTPRPALSLALPNFAPTDPPAWDALLDGARAADRAGVDRIVVFDHVAFGEHLEAYGDPAVGGDAGAKQPTGPDGSWLEPLTVLAAVSSITTRVRLATGIIIAPLRRPVVLAKTAATLDVLSGGRLDLGVGVGWQREEYDAAGLPFDGRGALLDHTLDICRRLWTEPAVDFDSGGVRFERIHQMPKPRQPGGVPLWISGRANPMVVRRVARFGAGWIPWGDDARDPRPGIAAMRRALDAAGRDPEGLEVTVNLPAVRGGDGLDLPATMAGVAPLVDAGVTDLRVPVVLSRLVGDVEGQLAEVVGHFRAAVARG